MARSQIRNRLLTARLVTMLLPGAAVLMPSTITPRFDFGIIAPWELPKSERWSRSTFALFRAEATRTVAPSEVPPLTAVPAKAQAVVPNPPLPGTVQNLRPAETP
jgi:hypothetical protein